MSSAGNVAKYLDLCGEVCPFTFVRCKLEMEDMRPGQVLHLIVDNADAASNVPRSLRDWGQDVVSVGPISGPSDQAAWEIIVVRCA